MLTRIKYLSPLSVMLAWRYLRRQRGTPLARAILWLATLGIALGVASLIVVLSVMNGFASELQGRLLTVVPELVLEARSTQTKADDVLEHLRAQPEVREASELIATEVLITHRNRVVGAQLQAAPASGSSSTASNEAKASDGVSLSNSLATELDVVLGDVVRVSVPQTKDGQWLGLSSPIALTVTEIFALNFNADGNHRVMTSTATASGLVRRAQTPTSIQVRLHNPYASAKLATKLRSDFGQQWLVTHWGEQQKQYFHAVKVEKLMMSVILMLIVAIAALNIVTSLVMFVKDKRYDIAIFRTMGAPRRTVRQTFFLLGLLSGGMGALLGVIGGVLLALNMSTISPALEKLLGRELFPSDVYLISGVPSELIWTDVIWVGVFSLLLGLLAGVYPAQRAASIEPASVLRARV